MSSVTEKDITGASASIADMDLTPWDVLSSRELAKLLGVSIQVLANWRIRDRGPVPAPAECFRGNRTYYPVFEIEAWQRGVEPWEVLSEWLRKRFIFKLPLETEDRTWRAIEQLQDTGVYPLKHRPRRPIPFPQIGTNF